MRTGKDWYKKSRYNHPVSIFFEGGGTSLIYFFFPQFDIHLCAYSCLLRIVAGFHDEIFSDPNSPSGLNKVFRRPLSSLLFFTDASPCRLQQVDFRQVTASHDANLTRFHEEWAAHFTEGPNANGNLFILVHPCCCSGLTDVLSSQDLAVAFRGSLLPLYVGACSIVVSFFCLHGHVFNSLVGYSRLVMYSFGFQHAFQRGLEPSDHVFFTKVCPRTSSRFDMKLKGGASVSTPPSR